MLSHYLCTLILMKGWGKIKWNNFPALQFKKVVPELIPEPFTKRKWKKFWIISVRKLFTI